MVTLMFTRPFPIVCEFLSFFSFSHQLFSNAISGIHHLPHSTRTRFYSRATKCYYHLQHQSSQETKLINTHGQYLLMYTTHTLLGNKFVDFAHYPPPLSDTCYLYKNAGTTQFELSKVVSFTWPCSCTCICVSSHQHQQPLYITCVIHKCSS